MIDIIGADDYELVGYGGDSIDDILSAASGASGLSDEDRQEALKEKMAREAVAIRRSSPRKARGYPLGFDAGATVAAAAAATIQSQPQVAFRVERLVVPSDIAGSFVIDDLIVGKNSQFANDQPVPARVFDEGGFGVRLRGDTAQVTMNVTLRVTNVSGAAVRFRAAVIGTAVE